MREVCRTTLQLHFALFNWNHMLYGVDVMYICVALLI